MSDDVLAKSEFGSQLETYNYLGDHDKHVFRPRRKRMQCRTLKRSMRSHTRRSSLRDVVQRSCSDLREEGAVLGIEEMVRY